ncbi:MAG: sodium-translocating pyrophosphatase [Candidatus Promineifilaceae bacterium]
MTLGTELLWIVPVAILIAIGLAIFLIYDVMRRDTGTAEMQAVSDTIYEGAIAFLRRQYTTIGLLAVVTAVVIGTLIGLFDKYIEVSGVTPFQFGVETAIAFLIGALLSSVSGIIAMWTAVKSNVRVAAAARRGVGETLTIALRGGAVSGFLVVALSLLGVWGLFEIYGRLHGDMAAAPFLIIGLGFGASFVALFAQLGGGIYTKAADVGADLVGKVEQGIPEDDPRNPAVIADLVGDNVGDCAGRGADLFESTVAENIGAMILGVAIWRVTDNTGWIVFPLILRSFGIIASLVGVFVARMHSEQENPMQALNRGYYTSAGLSILFLALCTYLMLGDAWYYFLAAGLVGLANAVAFLLITQYYTEGRYRPVQSIVQASATGSATNIISGLAVGMETTALPVIAISVALLASYGIGSAAADTLGVSTGVAGIFGTAVATMGMLMTAAYILAMDTFGPIADNAGGIVEMVGAPPEVRAGTDALDSAGNTTKALTKGYAIGSAALAAFLLFSAYLDKIELVVRTKGLASGLPIDEIERMAQAVHVVDLGKVPVFVGALTGAMLVFLFASLAIRAVGKAAEGMIKEVRRQFANDPGIMAGTSRPDYARAVDISTRAALREMILPGVLAVGLPIVVGVLLRAEAAAGLLMVGTMAGILMALMMNNGGGAWDNAKKYIETGVLGGKGSEAHAAAVVGDTVGDPFKDTAGPSLHVLIKLLATITLVLAPLFI